MPNTNYYVWVEITANKKRLLDPAVFSDMLQKCADAGIGSLILSVKDTSGFGLYHSKIVPHYSQFDKNFQSTDYLQTYLTMAHDFGLKLYAAVDVFAEGWTKQQNPLSPAVLHPEWQTMVYGLNEQYQPQITPITERGSLNTTGSIDDFSEIFVNPVMDEVQEYEVSILRELTENYDVDGIVLDRARFVGLSSDFSDYTRQRFEQYLGAKVKQWPEDIYRYLPEQSELGVDPGPLFGQWITFRARTISNFIKKVRDMVDTSPRKVEFLDYTGSWYPLYYMVGANWARRGYHAEQYYPWVDGKAFAQTGYAGMLDCLLSGFYYEDVTREDAERHNKPAYWYSVEGSGDMVQKVVGDAVPYVGSLFLEQYENNGAAFHKAVEMCFQKSSGCMLFDLSYIDDYGWWELCKV